MPNLVLEQECRVCHAVKPLGEFHKQSGIGFLKDDAVVVRSALKYLEERD